MPGCEPVGGRFEVDRAACRIRRARGRSGGEPPSGIYLDHGEVKSFPDGSLEAHCRASGGRIGGRGRDSSAGVGAGAKLTLLRRLRIDPPRAVAKASGVAVSLARSLSPTETGRRVVLDVERWAELRREHFVRWGLDQGARAPHGIGAQHDPRGAALGCPAGARSCPALGKTSGRCPRSTPSRSDVIAARGTGARADNPTLPPRIITDQPWRTAENARLVRSVVARNLSDKRRSSGMTQAAVAQASGVGRDTPTPLDALLQGLPGPPEVREVTRVTGPWPPTITARAVRATIARNVRDERHRARMSQKALARGAGMGRGAIARLEAGDREPRIMTLLPPRVSP